MCNEEKRFTLLHIANVLKSSNIRKIIDYGHNKLPYHGYLKEWEKSNIQRLLQHMVLKEYLNEKIYFSGDIPQSFLFLGPRHEELKDHTSIQFSIKNTASKAVKNAVPNKKGPSVKKDDASLEEQSIFKSSLSDEALRIVAQRLSEIESDIFKMPYVTRANFDKYGYKMLDITRKYATEKLCLLMDDMNEVENNNATSKLTRNPSGKRKYQRRSAEPKVKKNQRRIAGPKVIKKRGLISKSGTKHITAENIFSRPNNTILNNSFFKFLPPNHFN